jgi:hypothetical protein
MLFASAAALPLLLGTEGCRSSDAFAGPDPLAGPPPLGRDVLTLQAVIAAEENLIRLYRAALEGNAAAGRAQTLRTLLSQHEQHLVQLKGRLIVPPGASASPSPSASGAGGATASPGPGRVGTGRLRAAERASAADLVQRLATVPPALAQLFASIAASDATHVAVLGG